MDRIEKHYFWPMIDGMERECNYRMQLVDRWNSSNDEPSGELWEYIDDSVICEDESVDQVILELLAIKDSARYVNQ